MTRFLLPLSFVLGFGVAQAGVLPIDISGHTTLSALPGGSEKNLQIYGDSAEQIFAALKVPAQVLDAQRGMQMKTTAGLACASGFGGTVSCLIPLTTAKGALGAYKGPRSIDQITLYLSGPIAKELFLGLKVEEHALDAESFNVEKVGQGLTCSEERIHTVFNCVISVDTKSGVIQ